MQPYSPPMNTLVSFLLFGLMVFVCVAAGLILMALARSFGARRRPKSPPDHTVEMTCTVCERRLIFGRSAVELLSPPEMALVVRSCPKVVGRRLCEYVCPYCDASHCFVIGPKSLVWVGVNLYTPQTQSAHCFECNRILDRPPGGAAGMTQKIAEPAALPLGFGLKCSFCGAVCCVDCCKKASRGRTSDGSLACPRCRRKPINLLYFP